MALVLDFRNDWREMLHEFARELRRGLDEGIIEVVASPNPDAYFMDSNVLVVVDRLDRDTSMAVAKAALETNERYRSTISYMIVQKGDPTIEKFMEAASTA